MATHVVLEDHVVVNGRVPLGLGDCVGPHPPPLDAELGDGVADEEHGAGGDHLGAQRAGGELGQVALPEAGDAPPSGERGVGEGGVHGTGGSG